jgi:hypothetical protein
MRRARGKFVSGLCLWTLFGLKTGKMREIAKE